MASTSTYRTLIGDRQADITIDGERVLVEGDPINVDVCEVSDGLLSVIVDGKSYDVYVENKDRGEYTLTIRDQLRSVKVLSRRDLLLARYGVVDTLQSREKEIRAPMPGLVLNVYVSEGDVIDAGVSLLVLEAMKMENEVRAASSGSVARVHVRAGDAVGKNDLLIEIAS